MKKSWLAFLPPGRGLATPGLGLLITFHFPYTLVVNYSDLNWPIKSRPLEKIALSYSVLNLFFSYKLSRYLPVLSIFIRMLCKCSALNPGAYR